MFIVSRHILDYNKITIWQDNPNDEIVIRINLAWEDSINTLERHIKSISSNIFLDIPVGRTKPPHNKYSFYHILNIIRKYKHIKYLGISNVEDPEDLIMYVINSPNTLVIPKIESIKGCENISEIVIGLPEPRTIMLDHDDLFYDILKHNQNPDTLYTHYINPLINFCKTNNVRLLKTSGVIFSDEI